LNITVPERKAMQLTEEIASDLRAGTIFDVKGERIGIRPVRRVWFNAASGHYVADAGGVFMWTDKPANPWRCVPSRS
jgi:hypothetical protein